MKRFVLTLVVLGTLARGAHADSFQQSAAWTTPAVPDTEDWVFLVENSHL